MKNLVQSKLEIIKAYAKHKNSYSTQAFIRRNLRPAERLLVLFGFDAARVVYLVDCVAHFCENHRLSWTLETVSKLADRAQSESRPFKEVDMTGMNSIADLINQRLKQGYGRQEG